MSCAPPSSGVLFEKRGLPFLMSRIRTRLLMFALAPSAATGATPFSIPSRPPQKTSFPFGRVAIETAGGDLRDSLTFLGGRFANRGISAKGLVHAPVFAAFFASTAPVALGDPSVAAHRATIVVTTKMRFMVPPQIRRAAWPR
jgi:hypothetical protein